jgi:GNAT superfamily N-acetyltransferase
LTPIPPDHVATVVTTLEMRSRPEAAPVPPSPLRLVRWDRPSPDRYRGLFRRVGEPWLWFSRLAMDDARLLSIVHDPDVSVFAAVDGRGDEVGMVELDHRPARQCEIGYFALIPEKTGVGHGRWLMAQALDRAWGRLIDGVRVNTCTLDHPRALGFYRAQGFVAVSRTVETFPDPRAIGLLPAHAAPHVPYLASRR